MSSIDAKYKLLMSANVERTQKMSDIARAFALYRRVGYMALTYQNEEEISGGIENFNKLKSDMESEIESYKSVLSGDSATSAEDIAALLAQVEGLYAQVQEYEPKIEQALNGYCPADLYHFYFGDAFYIQVYIKAA